MSQLRHPWSEHYGGLHRPPGDCHAPWMVYPAPHQTPAYYFPTFKRAPWHSDLVCDGATKEQIKSKQDRVVQRNSVSARQRKGTCTKFWTLFNQLFPGDKKRRATKLDALTVPFNPHDHRKAYGHFSHPAVNRVQVRNSMFRCSSSATINPDDLWASLRRTDDSRCLGNWPGGIERPTLHPRPHAWPRMQSPPSHPVRLNPYLQHCCNGPHPIAFDITQGPEKIMHTTHAHAPSCSSAPLDPARLLRQPATYPPTTHMRLQAVAEDPLPHFPWPIAITNARGITCSDVLDAIARKFLERVSEAEYNTWTKHRRTMAAWTYHQRVRTLVDPASLGPDEEVPDVRDGLRRIDYVGSKVVFHGLEQAGAMLGDTWFVYFGAAESSTG